MDSMTCSIEDCQLQKHCRGWCKRHYERWRNTGDPLTPRKPMRRLDTLDRFWQKVNQDGPVPEHAPHLGPCWLWTASIDPGGYGTFYLGGGRDDGKQTTAHRASYILLVGPVANTMDIDHLCRVRSCVNPSHLEPTTRRVNVLRGMKGRMVESCPRGHAYDELNTHFNQRGHRSCRRCDAENARAKRARISAEKLGRKTV